MWPSRDLPWSPATSKQIFKLYEVKNSLFISIYTFLIFMIYELITSWHSHKANKCKLKGNILIICNSDHRFFPLEAAFVRQSLNSTLARLFIFSCFGWPNPMQSAPKEGEPKRETSSSFGKYAFCFSQVHVQQSCLRAKENIVKCQSTCR